MTPDDDRPRIRYEVLAPHVVRLVIDRPAVANALDRATFAELDAALDRIEADDDVRVWMLTGARRADGRPWFSAGADLKIAAGPGTVETFIFVVSGPAATRTRRVAGVRHFRASCRSYRAAPIGAGRLSGTVCRDSPSVSLRSEE